ncbi:oxidoreductase, partial [Salmonella enterica]|nr:oxidoreductase [Salmonella enterica]EEL7002375.1 oxidoreductase [Salmonella enterica subsp. enterica serovar Muenchen]EBB4423750.1 oxidoreductase [Salmonella enterica]EBO9844840.1 oxidoreductase [Salmonella enterica]ECO9081222.1 oxidoreductase [Salmonella enterica]
KIEFSISFQRCDEDMRERLQSSSVSDLLNGLKDKASAAYDSVNGAISGLL